MSRGSQNSIRMVVDDMIKEIEATVIQQNLASAADEAVPLHIVQDATSENQVSRTKCQRKAMHLVLSSL